MDGFEKVISSRINDGSDFLKRESIITNNIMHDILEGANRQREENEKLLKPIWENKEKVDQAQIETAKNTAEMRMDLKTVIENQNSMIKMLESQLKDINLTLDLTFNSLYDLKEISEDALKIYSSIHTQLIQGKKPDIKAHLLDKSSDIAIQVFFLVINGIMRQFGMS